MVYTFSFPAIFLYPPPAAFRIHMYRAQHPKALATNRIAMNRRSETTLERFDRKPVCQLPMTLGIIGEIL
jgi:hypothetical protein